jgi:hypothetical protein
MLSTKESSEHCARDRNISNKGNWQCVMKYESYLDFEMDTQDWNNFLQHYGSGYLNDRYLSYDFHCRDERALRPVDASHWPGN